MAETETALPALDFDPDQPIGWTPDWHRDVSAWPWAENEPGGFKRAAGMFDADGQHIPDSHCWRYAHEPCTIPPETDDREIPFHLTGRWLFGGLFYAHFGHFLVESTSRLWAAEGLDDIEGFLFYPKQRLSHEFKPLKPYQPFFQKLGLGGLKVRLPQVPVTVEQIAFPPPGIGIGEMIAGRPEYRRFMHQRLCDGVEPDGAPDIYVSRSGLTSRRGRIVMEEALEARMEDEGYRIFHPQGHNISEQIAQYRAARRIVALDGSALHLAAMVVEPGTKVAIINRGPSMNIDDYILQFRSFAGIEVTRIDAITGCWAPTGQRFVKREAQARLDFRAAGKVLAETGFIRRSRIWADPPEAQIDARIDALAQGIGVPLEYRDLS